ncbi:MAG: HEAT repeat domain-containing protein, partial [Proteobacteria bacterium]|nr:HEAT repeat domain-containing protein [Pseudomonadota bacterium]
MGIFDFFKGSGGDGKISKSAETVKNAKAIRDDRVAAIEYLAHDVKDPAKAVPALLMRFEFSLEHGINDSREKDICMEGIVKHGDLALPFVMEHLKNTSRIAWPIKLLKSLGGSEERVIECLISVLNYQDVSFDQAQTDKNYDVLCHLADYKHPGLAEKISHFLKDPDERVRYAAAEVLMEQDLAESGSILEPLLADPNPDNSRIRQTVIRKYLEH